MKEGQNENEGDKGHTVDNLADAVLCTGGCSI